MYDVTDWQHIFKLDPAKEIDEADLSALCESGTDAIMIGGTDNVTLENVLDLMSRVRRYTVPCILEISNLESVIPGFDHYLVPSVLNSSNVTYQHGILHEALKEYGHMIDFSEMSMEGYVVLNEDSKVARLTEANCQLNESDIEAYAMMIENLLSMRIMYIEYSGTYGSPDIVQSAKRHLNKTRLFYGGGIDSPERAQEMLQHADTIVVGNIIYEDLKRALKTVKAKR